MAPKAKAKLGGHADAVAALREQRQQAMTSVKALRAELRKDSVGPFPCRVNFLSASAPVLFLYLHEHSHTPRYRRIVATPA